MNVNTLQVTDEARDIDYDQKHQRSGVKYIDQNLT